VRAGGGLNGNDVPERAQTRAPARRLRRLTVTRARGSCAVCDCRLSACAVLIFFLVWYVINVMYNDYNKTVLRDLKLPWTVSALQLGLGLMFWVAPLWLTGMRKMPKISVDNAKDIFPVGVIHGMGQCVTVMSLGAGSLAFVNVVKSLEPLFNVAFGALFMNDILPWQVNACLLPVVGGVGIASAADLSFTWDCFAFAMGSNLAFSLRGVLSKKQMSSGKPKGENMDDPGNAFAVMTAFAFLSVIPVALAIEGPSLQKEWDAAMAKGVDPTDLTLRILGSGLAFYLYNEVSFYTLDSVHPITHAVGNTIKRVILILYSVVRFGSTLNMQGKVGSAIAIGGVFAYSVAKQQFKKPAKPKAA